MFFKNERIVALVNVKSESFGINHDIEMNFQDINIVDHIKSFKNIYDFSVFGHLLNGKKIVELNILYKNFPFESPLEKIKIEEKYINGMLLTDVSKEINNEIILTLKQVCFLNIS